MWNFVVQTAPLNLMLVWGMLTLWLYGLREKRLGQVLACIKVEDRIAIMELKKNTPKAERVRGLFWRLVPNYQFVWFLIAAPLFVPHFSRFVGWIAAYYTIWFIAMIMLRVWGRWSATARMSRFAEVKPYVLFDRKLLTLESLMSITVLVLMLWWVKRAGGAAAPPSL